MRTPFIISVATAVVMGAADLSAITVYQDVNSIHQRLDAKTRDLTNPTSYSGVFDIQSVDTDPTVTISGYLPLASNGTFVDAKGFTPGEQTAISGQATFYFSGLNWYDVFCVDLGSDGGVLAFLTGSVALSGHLSGASLNLINNSGQLSYTVTAGGTQFTAFNLDYAKLVVNASDIQTRDGSTNVPEGGSTVAFLGLALGGLAFLRRR
jgi:hypothetical protein